MTSTKTVSGTALFIRWFGQKRGAAARAGARERVGPISELVFGTLTQNRSSLEPSLGFAAIAGPPVLWIVYHTYKLLKEPKRGPKRLWRTRLDDSPASRPQTGPQKSWGAARTRCYSVLPSIRKINSKGTAPFSMRGVPAMAANSRESSRLLRFWLKPQTPIAKSARPPRRYQHPPPSIPAAHTIAFVSTATYFGSEYAED
jgi:hypothetical protein